MRKYHVYGLVLVLSTLLLVGHVGAEHTPDLRWMDQYKGADGTRCCAEPDCIEQPVRVLEMNSETVKVEVSGVELNIPMKSLHQSENGRTYWCCKFYRYSGTCKVVPTEENTRCIFYSIGS